MYSDSQRRSNTDITSLQYVHGAVQTSTLAMSVMLALFISS